MLTFDLSLYNPRWYRKNQAKLSREQKHLSRKKKGYSDLTGLSINEASAELVDNKRGEGVRLGDKIDRHLAASVKRLDKFIDLS